MPDPKGPSTPLDFASLPSTPLDFASLPSTPLDFASLPSTPLNSASLRAGWQVELRTRLASLRLSPARENDIVEELSQHLEDHYRELMAAGTRPDEAERAMLAQFREGNLLAEYLAPLRQAQMPPPVIPGASSGQWLADLRQDLRFAVRQFAKQPGFAVAAVMTLALGIGATTAIFSVVYGVLLKPLPFHEPDRLVSLYHHAPGVNVAEANQGPATYVTYRDNHRVFEAIGAWESDEVSITGRGEAEQVEALVVTSTTLAVLRVQPAVGRLFIREDDRPGSPLRVVLTYGYWQRGFGGVSDIVGQTLAIDGRAAEVIGVLPASFKFLSTDPAVLLPMQLDDVNVYRGIMFDFQGIARLKDGVELPEANADLARMIELLPRVFGILKLQPDVRPLAADVIGEVGRVLWILLAAVGVVLLIACGNVANLFLARAEGRRQEFAMRTALGASRGRLVRALLSESVALALAGGVLGLVLAQAAILMLRRLAPGELPRLDEIGIDLTVLLFTHVLSVLCGLLFGLAPAVKFGSANASALKEAGRLSSDAPSRHRTRNVLVVGEIALALMLMIVAGLMIRTFAALRDVDPGFKAPEQVQTFRIAIPERAIGDLEQVGRVFDSIAQRIAQVPGVVSVGLSSSITMDGEDNSNPLYVEDIPVVDNQLPPLRRFKSVAPGYFETLEIPLVAGRPISWTDIYEQRPVIMVSERIAREYWGEPARALGRRVRAGPSREWRQIVGVTGDELDDGLNQPPTAIVYWPFLNDSYQRRTMAYAVRSNRSGSAYVRELQRAVWSVNSDLPLAAVQTLDQIRASSLAQTSFAMVMLGMAAAVALLLGLVGIFGVITYIAKQRTREIGIRVALGAQIGDVRKMFLRQGLWLTVTGIALGVAAALVLTRVMSALLFGVGAADPGTYAVVSLLLAGVALVATYLPARRASQVDPAIALRAEA
jgi:predicted permease